MKKNEPTYSEALKASWHLAWNHKSLWPFAIFTMFLGQMGIAELLYRIGYAGSQAEIGGVWSYILFFFNPANWAHVFGSLGGDLGKVGWAFWLLVVMSGLALTFVYISVVSQGALVWAAARFTKKPHALPHDHEAWHKGVEHAGSIFIINIIRKFILFVISLAIVWALYYMYAVPGVGHAIFFATLIFGTLIGMILSIILVYAIGYMVVENFDLKEAIDASIHLLAQHWLVSFEIGLLLVLANMGVLVLIVAGMLYLLIIPLVIGKFFFFLSGSYIPLQITGMIGYLMFTAYAVTTYVIFTVFVHTSWTWLFMKMHKVGLSSRIKHALRARPKVSRS